MGQIVYDTLQYSATMLYYSSRARRPRCSVSRSSGSSPASSPARV